MKLWSDSRPDARFAGVVCALLRVGVCVMGLASAQTGSLGAVPALFLTNASAPSPAVSLAWNPSPAAAPFPGCATNHGPWPN